MLRALARASVDSLLPGVGYRYRILRDWYHSLYQTRIATGEGFTLTRHSAVASGSFEPEQTELCRELLQDTDVFVDVGANVGYYSCLAASRGVLALAVEPLPMNLARLYKNLDANGFDSVEVFPIALSNRVGLTRLYGAGTGASLNRRWSNASARHFRTVPTNTLDHLLAGRFEGKQLLIKIDAEGGELDIVRAASLTMARDPAPRWLVEVGIRGFDATGLNQSFKPVFTEFWNRQYFASTVDVERRILTQGDLEAFWANKDITYGTGNYYFFRK
jgi:FkbM family methyltransferase